MTENPTTNPSGNATSKPNDVKVTDASIKCSAEQSKNCEMPVVPELAKDIVRMIPVLEWFVLPFIIFITLSVFLIFYSFQFQLPSRLSLSGIPAVVFVLYLTITLAYSILHNLKSVLARRLARHAEPEKPVDVLQEEQGKVPPDEDSNANPETAVSPASKYDIVKLLVAQRIEEIVDGKDTVMYSIKEMIKLVKDSFEEGKAPSDGAIERGIKRVPEWKNRDKTLAEARRKAGYFGKTYDDRKKDDKRHNRKNLDFHVDVNSEGDRGTRTS